ncbi:LuxR C-terminal-related transcriptional regulator [Epilithonimonas sp.]|uniref:response regulator transcription factor n=1 Tax=Epilithonimonas sp. TaxID=2894511 RepID=UPI0028A065AC|nr:LuxR C-terminal-related transcriptional regulator [Epilithonimonas sp.]
MLFGLLNAAQGLDMGKIEQEIIRYNREGNHKLSQKKLSDYLLSGNLTKEEEANVLFYIATTYRSVNDHMMCLDYLNRSQAIAKTLSKDNLLRMKLDYEYAFVYFDFNQYDKCKEAMARIAARKYSNSHPEDDAYILMQEGFLLLKDRKLEQAGVKYDEALEIMREISSCNMPVVFGKMIELYGLQKDVKKAEGIYAESMKMAKSCDILKYKIYAASEMEKVYKLNGRLDDAYAIGALLDTLRKVDNLETKVAEMHMIDKAYVEKEQLKHEESDLFGVIVVLVVVILVAAFVVFAFYKNTKNLKKDKFKIKKELELANQELNSYSQNNTDYNDDSISQYLSPIDLEKLTDRQKDLLKLMIDGFSNKEIAEKLFITESTVKYHIKNIYSLLDLKDRKDLFKKFRN